MCTHPINRFASRQHRWIGLAVLLLLFTQLPIFSMDVQDVLELKKAAIGDAVIEAQIKAEAATFHLSTADLKQLKAAGASDALLLAMVSSGHPAPTSTPATPATLVSPANAGAPVAGQPNDAQPQTATLQLEMMDPTDLDVALDAQHQRITVALAGELGGDGAADRFAWRLTAGKRLAVTVPAGTYTIRWANDDQTFTATLGDGLTTKLIFSQASTKLFDALYLSIFRGENRIDGGRLHMLKVNPDGFKFAPVQGSDYTPANAAASASASAPPPAFEPVVAPADPADTAGVAALDVSPEPVVAPQPIYVAPTTYVAPPTCVEQSVYVPPPVVYYSDDCYPTCYTAPIYYSRPYCAPVIYRRPYYTSPRIYRTHDDFDGCRGGFAYTHPAHEHSVSVGGGRRGPSVAFGGRHGSVGFSRGGGGRHR
ncbi:MAG: hypothetical protein ACREJ2_14375 [Planctomycetota bacterium]